jgi:hypothetical protein
MFYYEELNHCYAYLPRDIMLEVQHLSNQCTVLMSFTLKYF